MFTASCNSYGRLPEKAKGFALIELFTSEGCSSCPSAERTLAELNEEYGKDILVMEFHVDYWDYIGWKDPFSKKEFSDRQRAYANVFNLNSVYTPQAVVNGKNELVGSDKDKMERVIKTDLVKGSTNVIHITSSRDGNKLVVNYDITNVEGEYLNIALVQRKASSDVRRGENTGRKLEHLNVVREFHTIDAKANGKELIGLPQGSILMNDYMIIVYTQRKDNMEVTGATQLVLN